MAVPGRKFVINLLADSNPATKAFGQVGKAAGRLKTPLGIATAAITATFAAVSAVAVKSFSELLKLGEEFNEVTRIISVGTGAVGSDLADLEQSFRDVARSVPNAFADVATVIAELDTRTDLSGEGLEEMAEQMLTLARLTGGDVQSTTRDVTRLFNRFGLSAEESADMLDLLFRASQASGAEVGQLAADVTKNAASLTGLGLSLEESVALIALFEREGVRTRTVVSALQTGFLKLTKDGSLPLNEALADTFAELQTLDEEAARAKGLEIFGTSALELVDAIRDGRLSVDDFTQQIVEGSSTIIGVAEDTDGFRVKLDELRNNLKLMFEPAAREVFENVTGLVESLIPAAQNVADAFERDGLQGALEQVAIEWDKIYTSKLEPLWLKFLAFLNDTVKPAAIQLGIDIGTDIAKAIANGLGNWLKNNWQSVISGLFGKINIPTAIIDNLSRLGLLPEFGYSTGSLGGTRAQKDELAQQGFPEFTAFAEGGLVMSPTLGLVGEAGPEVVIPLDRFERGMGGGDTYVINVSGALDSEGVARQIERVLRDSRRRTGGVLV
jgi:TP901 family phage tail tape measure protein